VAPLRWPVDFFQLSFAPPWLKPLVTLRTAVTQNTQMHESTRRYICGVYSPTSLAVLPYNTMIYYPELGSNYFHHC